jgi:K+-sensing histidine kinase KdpD
MGAAKLATGAEAGDLLAAVAEQLKVPLTVIARQAELAQLAGQPAANPALVQTQADAALQLVDSYLLGLQLMREQTQLELEPVSVSSTICDIAHALTRFAKQYGVDIQVDIAGRYQPVMAHARGLRAALLSLGYGLVEAQAAHEDKRLRKLRLATHRTPHGIIAGMYGMYDGVCAAQWRTALQLCGQAAQPFTALTSGSSAGLFVADTILRSMDSRLHVGNYARQRGLAAMLHPSQQLQLV